MPSASDYFYRKRLVAVSLTMEQWLSIPARIREFAFFVAGVDDVAILQAFFEVAVYVSTGRMGASEARQRMREFLADAGYAAAPGLQGTIEDLSSTARLQRIIDTNVDMARGWMQRCQMMANVTRPAQLFFRFSPAEKERDWKTRWKKAAGAVGWEGVSRKDGTMIALKTSPIWVALSHFGQPYPPFDYGSHMTVRSVSLEVAQAAGLLTTEEEYHDAREKMREESRRSLNEGVETDVKGWSYSLLREIEKQLKGLSVLDHGVLRMTDPNGTTPYWSQELARIISVPLPHGIPNLQLKALRDWMQRG